MLRQEWAASTIRNYAGTIARADAWLHAHHGVRVREASWEQLRDYAELRPYTYATRMGLRQAISAHWRYQRRPHPPVSAVPCPKKPRGKCRALPPGAHLKVIRAAKALGPDVYAAVCACYYASLRVSEAAGLRWTDIHPTHIALIGKGRKPREVRLHMALIAALGKLPQTGEFVFASRFAGRHASPNTIRERVRLAGAAAGYGRHVTPHVLRHTSLTNMLDGTKDLAGVAVHAGHSDTTTTMIYTRTGEARQQALMDAL
jgi:integrase/recombinase XerC